MERGLCVKNWINIRLKYGVILVADLPKVDADTQWATSDILRWRRKVSLAVIVPILMYASDVINYSK